MLQESEKFSCKNYLSGDSSFIIDCIRVMACEMVVLCHPFFIFNLFFNYPKDNTNPFYVIDNFLGNIGVILFFVVSGIVISNSLFKKLEDNNYRFIDYFIDRFSRIYSGLIPCLIFIFICNLILYEINPTYFDMFNRGEMSATSFIGSLLMLQNLRYIGTPLPSFAGVLWTLNLEWWLYLFFGWVIMNFKKQEKLNLFFLFPLVIFAYYPLSQLMRFSVENLTIVWFMGVAATIYYINTEKIYNKKYDYVLYALLLIILGRILAIKHNNLDFYDLTLEIFLVLFIVLLMAKFKNTNLFDQIKIKKVIKFMSKYSFTLYLVHYVIEHLIFCIYVTFNLRFSLILVFFIAILISNITAIVIAYPTEMHYKELAIFLNGFLKKIALVKI